MVNNVMPDLDYPEYPKLKRKPVYPIGDHIPLSCMLEDVDEIPPPRAVAEITDWREEGDELHECPHGIDVDFFCSLCESD